MTVTIAERSTHAARRQAALSRVTSVDAAAQGLVQALQDEGASVDPDRYPLVVAAARAPLTLVTGTGSGELHLLVDPGEGTAVRIRHDGIAATAEVVRVGPAPVQPAVAAPVADRPGPADRPVADQPGTPPAERSLRRGVQEEIARRRALQAERAAQLRTMASTPAPRRVSLT